MSNKRKTRKHKSQRIPASLNLVGDDEEYAIVALTLPPLVTEPYISAGGRIVYEVEDFAYGFEQPIMDSEGLGKYPRVWTSDPQMDLEDCARLSVDRLVERAFNHIEALLLEEISTLLTLARFHKGSEQGGIYAYLFQLTSEHHPALRHRYQAFLRAKGEVA